MQEIDAIGIFNFLQRRSRAIIASISTCLILAGLYIYFLPTSFSASTLLLVHPSERNAPGSAIYPLSNTTEAVRIESEVEILRSDAILLEVIARHDLTSDPEFGAPSGLGGQLSRILGLTSSEPPLSSTAAQSTLARLKSATRIQRRGQTYLVSIEVRSLNAQKAASLANAIAQTYLDHQVRSKVERGIEAYNLLDARIVQVRNDIVATESLLHDLLISSQDMPTKALPDWRPEPVKNGSLDIQPAFPPMPMLSQTVAFATTAHDWDVFSPGAWPVVMHESNQQLQIPAAGILIADYVSLSHDTTNQAHAIREQSFVQTPYVWDPANPAPSLREVATQGTSAPSHPSLHWSGPRFAGQAAVGFRH